MAACMLPQKEFKLLMLLNATILVFWEDNSVLGLNSTVDNRSGSLDSIQKLNITSVPLTSGKINSLS